MGSVKTITTFSPEETIETGAALAKLLKEGDCVALIGELGSGKTVFVKGLAKGLGFKDYQYVNSPSFVVVKEYNAGSRKLYHFDTYRLEGASFRDTMDYERYFYDNGITVIEWADKVADILPEEYIEIRIEHRGATQREFNFRAVGKRFDNIIGKL